MAKRKPALKPARDSCSWKSLAITFAIGVCAGLLLLIGSCRKEPTKDAMPMPPLPPMAKTSSVDARTVSVPMPQAPGACVVSTDAVPAPQSPQTTTVPPPVGEATEPAVDQKGVTQSERPGCAGGNCDYQDQDYRPQRFRLFGRRR